MLFLQIELGLDKKMVPADNVYQHLENPIVDEITPPPTPPSPPAPPAPPAPLWTRQDFEFHIDMIQNDLTTLEQLVTGPSIIYIEGVHHLRSNTGQNWEEKLNHLFFEAKIPFFWILDFIPDDTEDDDNDNDDDDGENEKPVNDEKANDPNSSHSTNDAPRRVRLYLINNHVKNKVLFTLRNYLRTEYDEIVYLE